MRGLIWDSLFLFCFVLLGLGSFFPCPINISYSYKTLPLPYKTGEIFPWAFPTLLNSRAQKEQEDKSNFVVAQVALFLSPHYCFYKRAVWLGFFGIDTIKCFLNGLTQQTLEVTPSRISYTPYSINTTVIFFSKSPVFYWNEAFLRMKWKFLRKCKCLKVTFLPQRRVRLNQTSTFSTVAKIYTIRAELKS